MSKKFCEILVRVCLKQVYHVTEAVQAVVKVPAVVASIVIVGALTLCALLHFMCDLKAKQINVQRCLIRSLCFTRSNWGHNA